MNTCNTEEICVDENQEQINDLVPEKPQVVAVEPYEVHAYVDHEGVRELDRRLHVWKAQQMLAANPDIFTRTLPNGYFYKLISINDDGRTGRVLTNEPNVAHACTFITLRERTTYFKDTIVLVSDEDWQFRAHTEVKITEEQAEELRRRHEKLEEAERQHQLDLLEKKKIIEQNTPAPDAPGTLAEWNLIVSHKDVPADVKLVYYDKCARGDTPVFGWWDGEEHFRANYGESPIAKKAPDFQLVSVDIENHKVTVKEFTPCPFEDKERYWLSFIIFVNRLDFQSSIKGMGGMYLLDMAPFYKDLAEYNQQQALLATMPQLEVENAE